MRRLIEHLEISDRVELVGALPNVAVCQRMSEAIAFVLPSHNETFGMSYLEALFAGTPILYSKGTGIDGFLDGLDVGIAVNPCSVWSIASGLIQLVEQNDRFRNSLSASAAELSQRFGREQVLAQYTETARDALRSYDILRSSRTGYVAAL